MNKLSNWYPGVLGRSAAWVACHLPRAVRYAVLSQMLQRWAAAARCGAIINLHPFDANCGQLMHFLLSERHGEEDVMELMNKASAVYEAISGVELGAGDRMAGRALDHLWQMRDHHDLFVVKN